MFLALRDLSIASTRGNATTTHSLNHFLNYVASNLEAKIIYRRSDMIICVDSDAAYLVAPKVRSRAAGYHYLGNHGLALFNGPVLVLSRILKAVMASAAEAECGGLFVNAQEAVLLRHTLEELGHGQPPTPLQTDNSTACGILNRTMKPKRSKSMDKNFWWLVDRVDQGQFRIFWAPGAVNLADYFTKLFSAGHHKKVRPIYLYEEGYSPSTLQGCVEILTSSAQRTMRA